MRKTVCSFSIILLLFVSGCATKGARMSDIMKECDEGRDFPKYAECLKTTYKEKGAQPESENVKAFYAFLDQVSLVYKDGHMTDTQAKDNAFWAWMATIDSSNMSLDSKFRRNASIDTGCIKVGSNLNCF